jgi:hypothetical protein
MNELIKLVAAKTGMPDSVAKIAVDTVLSQLKTKLPDGMGDQVIALLDGGKGLSSGTGGSAEALKGSLGGLFNKFK